MIVNIACPSILRLKVPNGGFVFSEVPSTVQDGNTGLYFINKRIPRTQLKLFPPNGIIGKGPVIRGDDDDLGPQFCGAIKNV
jgi:hypothetical protein